jgi:hypothetical protein
MEGHRMTAYQEHKQRQKMRKLGMLHASQDKLRAEGIGPCLRTGCLAYDEAYREAYGVKVYDEYFQFHYRAEGPWSGREVTKS